MKNASIWLAIKGANLVARARDLRNDRDGVTSMEYGIIAATTVVVVGGVVAGLGTPLNTIWTNISTALTAAA